RSRRARRRCRSTARSTTSRASRAISASSASSSPASGSFDEAERGQPGVDRVGGDAVAGGVEVPVDERQHLAAVTLEVFAQRHHRNAEPREQPLQTLFGIIQSQRYAGKRLGQRAPIGQFTFEWEYHRQIGNVLFFAKRRGLFQDG